MIEKGVNETVTSDRGERKKKTCYADHKLNGIRAGE